MEQQNVEQQLQQTKKPVRLHEQRGSVAVEFALILPVLAVLLFAVIDFGRMLWFKEVLVNATRDGARMGTLYDSGNNTAAIQARIQQSLIDGGMAPTNLVVATPNGNPTLQTTGDQVTITSTVDWNYLVLDKLVPAGTFSGTTLQAAITMVHE